MCQRMSSVKIGEEVFPVCGADRVDYENPRMAGCVEETVCWFL